MNKDIEKLVAEGRLNNGFVNLFKREIDGNYYQAIFGNSKTKPYAMSSLRLVPFVSQMNELGTLLIGSGLAEDYLLTDSYLLYYSTIDLWKIVNNPPRYDGTDTWICKAGELRDAIPLSEVEDIEVESGNKYYSWQAKTVEKDRNPLAGAIVGGAIAGSTGAVVGAIVNSGKKKVITMPAGFSDSTELRIGFKLKDGRTFDMTVANAVVTNRNRHPVIDYSHYFNRINYTLPIGKTITAEGILDGSAGETLKETIEKLVEAAKQRAQEKSKSDAFLDSNPQIVLKINRIKTELRSECNQLGATINSINGAINQHVYEERRKNAPIVNSKAEELERASFFKKGKIKKELEALKKQREEIQPRNAFDDYMKDQLGKLKPLEKRKAAAENFIQRLDAVVNDSLNDNAQKTIQIISNPDFDLEKDVLIKEQDNASTSEGRDIDTTGLFEYKINDLERGVDGKKIVHTIKKVYIKSGDFVDIDTPLFVIHGSLGLDEDTTYNAGIYGAGRIVDVLVKEGDKVLPNTTLALIDTTVK